MTPVSNHAWVANYNRKVAEILLQGESAVGKIITEGPARGEVLKRQTYGENGDEYFWVKQKAEVHSRIILYYIVTLLRVYHFCEKLTFESLFVTAFLA